MKKNQVMVLFPQKRCGTSLFFSLSVLFQKLTPKNLFIFWNHALSVNIKITCALKPKLVLAVKKNAFN